MIGQPTDETWMYRALELAYYAFEEGEIPVGAIVVAEGKIIGKGYNQTEKLHDVTAHAEMLAITAAAQHLNAKYLNRCTLYVTLEPCVMCAGALFWSQIGRLVYGASDDKRGYVGKDTNLLHPKTQVVSGVLAAESESLMKAFFQRLRN
ncbi:tRNA adenosine(34) deaminase TadA [Xanthocytophaga agilis]|uniref:tRNA-specific adenosine deaminase n=1 Tax=Xanthocytophaga agilis TaxID=3048010 RepID=A0AAE3R7C2_9BACT|nr:tRNA adenosine(34) deaminase TadA [Xanthocytophaga agilis]MDJ1504981.1 tRNA adenosine(34) deaminase TadA [Xanthocytophaga agilis]